MKIKYTCPFGHTCEKVVADDDGGHMERCQLYTKVSGVDPQTGEALREEWKCAIAWGPVLSLEVAARVRGMTQAAESNRNEVAGTRQELARLNNNMRLGHDS